MPLLVLIPIPIAITYVSAYFLPKIGFDFTSAVCNSGMLAALSLACFGLEYLHCQKKDVEEGRKMKTILLHGLGRPQQVE